MPLHHHLVHFHDARRREGARKRGCGTRGESKARSIVEIKVALDLTARMASIGKAQNVMVIALVDERRIVNLHELLVTVVVRQGDEQVERLAGWEQRRARTLSRAHGRHGVIHETRHHPPVERRLEPARANKQKKLLPYLHVGDRTEASEPRYRPQERLKEPLAPGAGTRVGRKEN